MSSYQEFDTLYKYLVTSDCKSGGPESREDVYSRWADKYDQDMSTHWQYREGNVMVTQLLVDALGDRKDAKILDLGAGTGRCGVELHKRGFHNLDALDASRQMLDQAEKKGIFSKLICDTLGTNKLDVPDATYDGIVSAGVFVPNHADDSSFEEIIRIMAPGAYLTFFINEKFFQHDDFKRFEPRIEELASRGFWKVQKREHRQYQKKLHDEEAITGFMYTIQRT